MTTFDSVQRDAPIARPARPKMSWAWLGLLPFFIFAFLFLLYPSSAIAVRSFQNSTTHAFTLDNIKGLFVGREAAYILGAYWISIKLSLVTSVGGGIFGFLLAYA